MPSQISRNKLQHNSWQFEAIGTRWTIETAGLLDDKLKAAISERIDQFDHIYSRFRDDSVVTQMSKNAGTFELSSESGAMASLYRKLYDATDGAMTPLVGSSLVAAGYDKDYSFVPIAPLPSSVWDDVLDWTDSAAIITQPTTLDIGALGKGMLVDMIGSELEIAGINNYVIDASGDIRHRGSDTQTIGLEDPNDTTRVIGMMPLSDASLCASAVNRRRWGNEWHHVIDARTGKPTKDIVATWVIAPTTMEADGLATALFFVDAGKLQHITDFQFVRLFADGRIEYSRDFVGQLYI
ncbi:MAG: FAD:protein transferase [Candidatus Saccharibacteria bacterium]|nr:FAD:protein transferase [Candidatus Saccharibacteria bacterium]